MEYYYADSTDEAYGPVSEEVLKNLFFQRRITLDSYVLPAGTSEWRGLRHCFPDLEFYRGCPKCEQKITIEENSCPHCLFLVGMFLENCRQAKKTVGRSSANDQSAINAEIQRMKNFPAVGCIILGIIILASISLFIPVIGPLFAIFIIVGGIAGVIKAKAQETDATIRNQAISNLSRAYSGQCPQCAHHFEHIKFSEPKVACPSCTKLIQEQNGVIYWVPDFTVALSDDHEHYFQFTESN